MVLIRKLLVLILSAAILVSASAYPDTLAVPAKDSKVASLKKCLFPKSKRRAPAWICDAEADNLAMTAVGSFARSGAGTAFVEQMAAADARAKLANKLSLSVQKDAAEREGVELNDNALIGKITNEELRGTRVLKSVYGPRGRLYVLMGFDAVEAQKLQDAVTADYQAQKTK